MTPASARELQKLGHDCLIQSGAGALAGFAVALAAYFGAGYAGSLLAFEYLS